MTNPELSERTVYDRIYDLVRQIPRGKVATYGQIAQAVGSSTPRMVGYAMAALRNGTHPDVPWQRVINRMGRISILDAYGGALQRQILEEEGVVFNARDQVDFERFGWLGVP